METKRRIIATGLPCRYTFYLYDSTKSGMARVGWEDAEMSIGYAAEPLTIAAYIDIVKPIVSHGRVCVGITGSERVIYVQDELVRAA